MYIQKMSSSVQRKIGARMADAPAPRPDPRLVNWFGRLTQNKHLMRHEAFTRLGLYRHGLNPNAHVLRRAVTYGFIEPALPVRAGGYSLPAYKITAQGKEFAEHLPRKQERVDEFLSPPVRKLLKHIKDTFKDDSFIVDNLEGNYFNSKGERDRVQHYLQMLEGERLLEAERSQVGLHRIPRYKLTAEGRAFADFFAKGARMAAENISSMRTEIEGYLSETKEWMAQKPWKFFDVEGADEKQAEDIGKHLETLNKIIEKRHQGLLANADAATAVMLRIRHQEILRAAQDQVILLKALTDLHKGRLPLHEAIHSNANTTHRVYKMEWRGESYTMVVLTRWGEGNMGQVSRFQMKIRMPGQRQRPNLRIDYSIEPREGAWLDAPESMHRFTTSKTRHRKLPRLNHFGTFSRFIQKLDRRMWMDTSQFSPENPFGFEKEGRLPTGIIRTLYKEEPVDEKQAVTFIAKVYQAKKKTGFIAVGNSAFEVQINGKGELLVYGFGKLLRVLDRAAYQSIVWEEKNPQSYQVTLSMSDFKQILDQAYALIDALEINESLNSKKAVAVIDLNGLLPGMPAFDEIRVPLLIREIKRAKKQSWGRNAKFLLKGDAETVERVMAQVRAFYGKEPDFIAAKEEDLKDYRDASRIIITSPDLHFLNEGAGQRHFFIQAPREGDIPNFRGAFKMSLALARLDKLEATDPALVEIIHTFELMLGYKIINPNELINIWQGRAHHPLHSRRYALPPLAKLSLQALLQGARLAIKMAEQAA